MATTDGIDDLLSRTEQAQSPTSDVSDLLSRVADPARSRPPVPPVPVALPAEEDDVSDLLARLPEERAGSDVSDLLGRLPPEAAPIKLPGAGLSATDPTKLSPLVEHLPQPAAVPEEGDPNFFGRLKQRYVAGSKALGADTAMTDALVGMAAGRTDTADVTALAQQQAALNAQNAAFAAQQAAAAKAQASADKQATLADIANNRANRKSPNIGAMLTGNDRAGASGAASTMLTGASGATGGTLGRANLLGS
jgi:hypothetical protein